MNIDVLKHFVRINFFHHLHSKYTAPLSLRSNRSTLGTPVDGKKEELETISCIGRNEVSRTSLGSMSLANGMESRTYTRTCFDTECN